MIHPPITTIFVLLDCIIKITTIGLRGFFQDRISSSFHPILNNYFRSNKLGHRFKYSSWHRNIVQLLWQLHDTAWLEYCDNIYSPTNLKVLPSPVKNILLSLVKKYITEAGILPTYQNIFFSCAKLQYLKQNIKELQRWLGTARKILQGYILSLKYIERTKNTSTYSTTYDPNNNVSSQTTTTIHIIYKALQTHHLKVSPLTNYCRSSKTSIPITLSNSPIPTVPNTNLDTGTIKKNVVTTITISINTVVDQDIPNQHNNNHERNQKHLTKLLISQLHRNDRM